MQYISWFVALACWCWNKLD